MDLLGHRPHHAPVRVLPHIKKLDDCFGDLLVCITCSCGVSRHIEPEALARIAGRSVTLAALAQRTRYSRCAKEPPVVGVVKAETRGHSENSH